MAAGIALAACLIYYAAKQATVVPIASAQVVAVPFTAEMHSYTYTSTATGELLAKRMLARRSDGTTSSTHSAGPIEKGWTARRIQYMDGRCATVVDRAMAMVRGSSGASELAGLKRRLMSSPANCVLDSSLKFVGYESVLGRKLAKVVRDGSTSVYVAWHDPELGCEVLQATTDRKQPDGSLRNASRLMLVGIRLAEPESSLFEEPSSYQQVFGAKELESRFEGAVKNELPPAPSPR